jgi:hypothetical protein
VLGGGNGSIPFMDFLSYDVMVVFVTDYTYSIGHILLLKGCSA